MKRIAVLGGGPAGAFAAEKLATAGLDVILLDEKLAWEKPCGGGLTYKAYNQYPFLIENNTPKRLVTQTYLSTSRTGAAKMALTKPLVIYSRFELNQMLLRRAEAAGAQLEKARVLSIDRAGRGWSVKTRAGKLDVDYCVVATGARNPLREVGTQLATGDTMIAMGYYVPGEQDHVDLEFFAGFEGYIWVFPRNGHLSVGIGGKGEPAQKLRARLERYMAKKDISLTGATFYSHLLPSLQRPAWKTNRVSGYGWMAVGDAAGLVDPITGEGLYYAVRSADIAAGLILSGQTQAYRERLQSDFIGDLELASKLGPWLFLDSFLCGSVTERMIQFMRRSPTLCDIVQDLFAGTQNYLDLKARLKRNVRSTFQEVVFHPFS
ncbi:MAG: FAD-dependent oxidoreductase [Bryobacteraceae bacterium]